MLSDAIPDLAIKAREMQRQIAVACLVEIKQFFESGNGGFDPISNLRRAISGYDHPPLHDLWRRLVIKDKQARRGYRRANPRAGIKGTPGVFAKGWGPCELRWVSEEWAKTALRLERGSVYPVNKEVRNAVFARAKANMGARQFKIFLSEFSGGTGYWQLPPRPFSHIFSSARMNARFREIGEQILAGTYKPSGDLAQPSKPAWTEDPRYKGEAASEFDVSYDDAAATWNALVAEGASPAGGGRHVGIKKRSE